MAENLPEGMRENDEVTLNRQLTHAETVKFFKEQSDRLAGGSPGAPIAHPSFCSYCRPTFIGLKLKMCSYNIVGDSVTYHCTYR
jgi:hypothetical protein